MACDPVEVRQALIDILKRCFDYCDRREIVPDYIFVGTPAQSFLLMSEDYDFLTPILSSQAPLLPRKFVPSDFNEADLTRICRMSPIRRLREFSAARYATLALQERVWATTMGGLIYGTLTGQIADCVFPAAFSVGDSLRLSEQAYGLEHGSVHRQVDAREQVGYLSPSFGHTLPVVCFGNTEAAMVRGVNADAESWCVIFGDTVCAAWCDAKNSVLELCIRESPGEEEQIPLTSYIADRLGSRLKIEKYADGRKDGYFIRFADLPHIFREGLSEIVSVPPGCDGVHANCFEHRIDWLGTTASTRINDFARAYVEGIAFELKRLRLTFGLHGKGCLRLLCDESQRIAIAQIISGICGENIALSGESPALAAVRGHWMALSRGEKGASYSVPAEFFEPGSLSAIYEPFFRIHCALN